MQISKPLDEMIRVEIRHIPFCETRRVVWYVDRPHDACEVLYGLRLAAYSLLDALEYLNVRGKIGRGIPQYGAITHPETEIEPEGRIGSLPRFEFTGLSLNKLPITNSTDGGVLRFSLDGHGDYSEVAFDKNIMDEICNCILMITDQTESEQCDLFLEQFKKLEKLFVGGL